MIEALNKRYPKGSILKYKNSFYTVGEIEKYGMILHASPYTDNLYIGIGELLAKPEDFKVISTNRDWHLREKSHITNTTVEVIENFLWEQDYDRTSPEQEIHQLRRMMLALVQILPEDSQEAIFMSLGLKLVPNTNKDEEND